jgi:hypothetical protein
VFTAYCYAIFFNGLIPVLAGRFISRDEGHGVRQRPGYPTTVPLPMVAMRRLPWPAARLILYTLIESCRRRKLDPYVYLRDVLTRMPQMTINHEIIPSLSPQREQSHNRQSIFI